MSASSPSKNKADDVTLLLRRATEGDEEAERSLIPLIYGELRKKARQLRAHEHASLSLDATDIVHDAYLRLMRGTPVSFTDRTHFFRAAAQVMHRILVDHARKRTAQRRGGTSVTVPLEDYMLVSEDEADRILRIDEALQRLRTVAERSAIVVEMRFFTGLTEDEIAECLNLSTKTVKRDWKFAKEYFRNELPL